MTQSHLSIVRIVCGRHLHCASAERLVHKVVAQDRNSAINERNDHPLPDHARIAPVIGVNGNRRITEQRLGTRGCDNDPFTRRATLQRVTNLPDLPTLLYGNRLKIRHARLAARAPVDEGFGAIRETTLIECGERGAHGTARNVVHGEASAAPIGGCAETAELSKDDATRLLHESIHPLQISIAPEAAATLPLFRNDLVEHELCRN